MQSQGQSTFQVLSQEEFNNLFQGRQYIGKGTQGQVYSARNINGDKVAIKQFVKKIVSESFKYVSAQINSLKILDHPSILKFYGCYNVGQNYYLATEFCDGGTLTQLIKKYKCRLAQNVKMSICLQLAQGIQHAHKHNVMHRDLKPDNILLTQNNQIKIIDFGCSKSVQSQLTASMLQTAIVGTPLYSAPDMKEGNYSKKCDIYSLGLIFYEIFTGNLPFKADNVMELKEESLKLSKNLDARIAAMKYGNSLIKEIIIGCLKPNEKDRFDATTTVNQLCSYFKPIVSTLSTSHQSISDDVSPEKVFLGHLISSTEQSQLHQKRILAKKLVFSKITTNKQIIDKDVFRLQDLQSVSKESKQMFFVLVVAYYQYWLRNFSKFLYSQSSVYATRYKDLNPSLLDAEFIQAIQTHIRSELKRTGNAVLPFARKIYQRLSITGNSWRPSRYTQIINSALGSMEECGKLKEDDIKNAIKQTFQKKVYPQFHKQNYNDNENIIILRRLIQNFK